MIMAEAKPTPRGTQFFEVLEVLEELNVQAARLQTAIDKSLDWLHSESRMGDDHDADQR
jgi:hypothetical protein